MHGPAPPPRHPPATAGSASNEVCAHVLHPPATAGSASNEVCAHVLHCALVKRERVQKTGMADVARDGEKGKGKKTMAKQWQNWG